MANRELYAMTKKRRVYNTRIVGGKVMMPADLERLHKYMLEIEGIDHISDEMRAVVESEWPELVHKLRRKSDTDPREGNNAKSVFGHLCHIYISIR
jgi:hypothetical protein